MSEVVWVVTGADYNGNWVVAVYRKEELATQRCRLLEEFEMDRRKRASEAWQQIPKEMRNEYPRTTEQREAFRKYWDIQEEVNPFDREHEGHGDAHASYCIEKSTLEDS